MDDLTKQEQSELFELLEQYVNSNPEFTFTLALERIRQRIGRPIVHVRDREILQYLQQWKAKQDRMSGEPANNGQV